MKIFVRAGGLLLDYLKPDVDAYTRAFEIAEGQTLGEVLATVGIRPVHVAMVFAGGKIVDLDYRPRDGETLSLRPPVQGG